jgi:hypothetical protein
MDMDGHSSGGFEADKLAAIPDDYYQEIAVAV